MELFYCLLFALLSSRSTSIRDYTGELLCLLLHGICCHLSRYQSRASSLKRREDIRGQGSFSGTLCEFASHQPGLHRILLTSKKTWECRSGMKGKWATKVEGMWRDAELWVMRRVYFSRWEISSTHQLCQKGKLKLSSTYVWAFYPWIQGNLGGGW